MARRGPVTAMNRSFDNEPRKRGRTVPNHEETGPVGTGARTGRGLGRCGRRAERMTSVDDDPYQGEGRGWHRQGWGDELTRRAAEDSGPPGATAGEQESFRRGEIEALLVAELDTLRQMLSEYLRGNAEKLTAELDRVKALLSEYAPGDAEVEE